MDFIIKWKNKGFLVLVYLITFFIIVTTLSGVLDRNIGGVFSSHYNKIILYGIICILSGIASIISDKYTIENGKLVKEDFKINEFFFIQMKVWGYILLFFGILNLIGGYLEN